MRSSRASRASGAAFAALLLSACSSSAGFSAPNSGAGAGQDARPRDQAAVVQVFQDPAPTPYVHLGRIRAAGPSLSFDTMEALKAQARCMGADALTNVQSVPGSDGPMYEADAIQWRRD
jgi:hypothetical protein